MILNYTINSDEVAEAMVAKGETLMDAIAAAVGLGGESLYEAIMYNMTGGIIQSRTGLLASSVQLSPVVREGSAATVWCEIPDDGSFEHLVGMVLEFGGTQTAKLGKLFLHRQFGEDRRRRRRSARCARRAASRRLRP